MIKWLWAIFTLAIISALITLFTPWGASQHSVEMRDSIQSAIASSGQYDYAKVTMSGNVATLTGIAPSMASVSEVLKIAQTTECETCKVKGKIWHTVENKMTIDPNANSGKSNAVAVVSPYRFDATKYADGKVDLSGYVENQNDRDRLLSEATMLFGDNLRGQKLRIAPGAPNKNWSEVISLHLAKLASLDNGTFSLDDGQALLKGRVTDPAIRANVNEVVASLPAGYNGATNVMVPNAAILNSGEIRSAVLCQTLFDDIKGTKRINFASGNSQIRGAQSYDLLNALAAAAVQCKSFRILIEGHTDNEGEEASNQDLSEQRAIEVANYLSENNVEKSRLTAKGFGETQPIAPNETPEGRAANRRITFVVTQSE